MRRCLNDIFGYCTGEPEITEEKEVKSGDLTVTAKKCKLDSKTCGKHQLFSEQVSGDELKDPHMTETIAPPKASKKVKSGKKEKAIEGVKLF